MASVLAVPKMQSPFDRRTYPIYILIAAVGSIGLLLAVALGFSIQLSIMPQFFNVPLSSVAAGLALRRIGYERLAGAMEAMGLFYLQGLTALLLIVPLAAISGSYADNWLAASDTAIGFDWTTYYHATQSIRPLLTFCYHSFLWQPALVAFLLFFTGRGERCWSAVLAAAIAVTVTAVMFPFAPAIGAARHYGLPDIPHPFSPSLIALKNGTRIMGGKFFGGLVSFPSYHTAAAVIFSWSCWVTRLRWFIVALNVLLVAATMPLGSHYLVDLIAGAIVAASSVAAARGLGSATNVNRRTR